MTDFVPGWSVVRDIPLEVRDGLNTGAYVLHGGVVRHAPGTDAAGRIVSHLLLPLSSDSVQQTSSETLAPALLRSTQQVLDVTTRSMHLAGLHLAVSAIGFGVLYAKLSALDESLTAIRDSVEGIARLLELEERAELRSALKILSMVMQDGSEDARDQQLLHGVLNVFGPVNAKYREILPKSTPETAMACQDYFALTSIATAACAAELGMMGGARRNLMDDSIFWADQARHIARRDLLGTHPERFMAGEFVPEVSLSEVAAWLNFAHNETRGERERIDELRLNVRLSSDEDGSWLSWRDSTRKAKRGKGIEKDRNETIPSLRKLVARYDAFQGYADQYALLDDAQLTPSAFQRRVKDLGPDAAVGGYLILQRAPSPG